MKIWKSSKSLIEKIHIRGSRHRNDHWVTVPYVAAFPSSKGTTFMKGPHTKKHSQPPQLVPEKRRIDPKKKNSSFELHLDPPQDPLFSHRHHITK
jgi:hypothetical protein